MGDSKPATNWSRPFQLQHVPLAAAPISSLHMWPHWADCTPHTPWVPDPTSTRGHTPWSAQPQPWQSELAAAAEPNWIAASYARRRVQLVLQNLYYYLVFQEWVQRFPWARPAWGMSILKPPILTPKWHIPIMMWGDAPWWWRASFSKRTSCI